MSEAEKVTVTDVTWETPPTRSGYDWEAIAAQLRTRPGEWARVFERDRISLVNAIRQGSVAALDPAKGFEILTRNNVREPIRMCSLYMRYNKER